jgi:hypothetical protein
MVEEYFDLMFIVHVFTSLATMYAHMLICLWTGYKCTQQRGCKVLQVNIHTHFEGVEKWLPNNMTQTIVVLCCIDTTLTHVKS